MKRQLIFLCVLVSLMALQGCLGNKKKDLSDAPVELSRIDGGLDIQKLWSAKLGKAAKHLNLGLRPSSDGTRVFAASYSGVVTGFDLATGKSDWSVDTDLPLTAGPGYGSGLVVAGSADGDVVALDAINGTRRWTQAVAGELLAIPVVYSDVVIVSSVDGSVHALEASDGSLRWTVEASVPRLTLRGSGQPAASGDRVVVGFDNGQVAALSLRDGSDLWNAPLALGRGRSELERLSDIDSNIVIIGDEVYVAGFQSRAALLHLSDGQAAWVTDVSSSGGLAADWTALYSIDGDSAVYALARQSGEQVWEQDALLHRGLTGPTPFGQAVVLGDFEGYLHWLSATDGTLVARTRAGKARIVTPPLAVSNRLLVQDEAGMLHAFAMPDTPQQPLPQPQPQTQP